MLRKTLQLLIAFSFTLFVVSCSQTQQSEEAVEEDMESTEEVDAEEEEEKPLASPRATATGEIGGTSIVVDYGSPSVKGREVWGGLEKYGKVWRAGANQTTNIEFSSDVVVGGQEIAAGKYGFFIIPNENEEWTIVFNTQWSQEDHGIWGAMGYSEENDVARINIMPEFGEEVTERLEYQVTEDAIVFSWEKAKLTIPVEPAPASE